MQPSNQPQLGHPSVNAVRDGYLRIPARKTDPDPSPGYVRVSDVAGEEQSVLASMTPEQLLAALVLAGRPSQLTTIEVQEGLGTVGRYVHRRDPFRPDDAR
jgi:hypothetical protein